MPTTDAAPLISALAVTLRVAGSMVTMDLPSIRPTIEPACALFAARSDAASGPAKAIVFRCMEVSRSHERQVREAAPPAMTGAATGLGRSRCAAMVTYSLDSMRRGVRTVLATRER